MHGRLHPVSCPALSCIGSESLAFRAVLCQKEKKKEEGAKGALLLSPDPNAHTRSARS